MAGENEARSVEEAHGEAEAAAFEAATADDGGQAPRCAVSPVEGVPAGEASALDAADSQAPSAASSAGTVADEQAAPIDDAAAEQVGPKADEEPADDAEVHEPTAEERELAENNALADVFDDVRKQSADSALVTPDRWADQGLIPDHMTADEFEMLVYEYLEDYRREHKDEIAEEKRERAAKRSSVRSATHAVGVPPKIPNRRLAQKEADEEAAHKEDVARGEAAAGAEVDRAASSDASAAAGASKDEPASALAAGTASVSEGVDQGSQAENAVAAQATEPYAADGADVAAGDDADSDDPFAGLKIPEGYKLVELEGEYVLVPDEDAKPVRKEIHCEHIVTLVGQRSYYLYDSDLMTKSYAHWAFLAAEDNPLATFVDCVREEGRVYPRPLSKSDLANAPFNMSASKVEETWGKLVESGDYPDIERCEASNGDVYFFSTLYMTRVLAESLAEYESVERKANV